MGVLVNRDDIRVDGTLDAPASAMAKGLAVKISSGSIAKCSAGDRPYGFLQTVVTTDGLSYLEEVTIPHADVEETKVSVGKVEVVVWESGRIVTDNIKSGESWSVDDLIAVTDSGVLTSSPASGDHYIGKVTDASVAVAGETGCAEITLSHDLGTKA